MQVWYTSTDFTYTGQRDLPGTGLMDYKARFFSPYINRFLQPDSIIPDLTNPQSWNRYSYVINNPLRFTDPTGHREVEGCGDEGKGACHASDLEIALNQQKLAELEYDPSGQKQKKNRENAEVVLYDGTELVASVLFEPADWAYTANHCFNGECSPWMLAGLLPFIPSSIGKHADDIIDAGKGFDNFRQLKKVIGDAGDNMEWHHMVEQSQIVKSGFSPRQVHNVENVLAVDKTVHRQISGYYSSIDVMTGGKRVRDWLIGKSFDFQYNFGLDVLKRFDAIK